MTHRVVVLDSAKEDFKDIQRYVKKNFGQTVWRAVHDEYQDAFRRIQQAPQAGSPIEWLADLSMSHVPCPLGPGSTNPAGLRVR